MSVTGCQTAATHRARLCRQNNGSTAARLCLNIVLYCSCGWPPSRTPSWTERCCTETVKTHKLDSISQPRYSRVRMQIVPQVDPTDLSATQHMRCSSALLRSAALLMVNKAGDFKDRKRLGAGCMREYRSPLKVTELAAASMREWPSKASPLFQSIPCVDE